MGVWVFITTQSESLSKNTPDLTSIKSLCLTSIDYSRNAAGRIGTTINLTGDSLRKNAPDLASVKTLCTNSFNSSVEKLNHHLSDVETRAEIARTTTKIAKNSAVYACQEGMKSIPGGTAVFNIASRSLGADINPEKQKEMKAVKAKVDSLEKEVVILRTLYEQQLMKEEHESVLKSHTEPLLHQKPEDVIRIFMMKGFVGGHLLNDLKVPTDKSRGRNQVSLDIG